MFLVNLVAKETATDHNILILKVKKPVEILV
jgi:hypothetical protein